MCGSTGVPETSHIAPYLLCIDLGSSSVKVAVCAANGDIAGSASVPSVYSKLELDGDLGVRYDAVEMLRRVSACAVISLANSGIGPNQIVGCAITSQRQGLAVLAEDLSPLLISPNRDLRAVFQGATIDERIGDLVWSETAHLPSYLSAWAKLQWLAEEEPELLANAAYALTLSDWLVTAMTGSPAIDASNGVESALVNVESGKYSSALSSEFSFALNNDIAIPNSGSISGELSVSFAKTLGIKPGLPVINCGPDTQVALAGLGVTSPGDAAVIAGWSCVLQVVSDSPVRDPERRMWTGRHVLPDLWVLESNASVMGGAYEWLIALLNDDGSATDKMDEVATRLAETDSQVTHSSVHLMPPTVDISNPGLQFGGIGFPVPLALVNPDRIDVIRAAMHGFGFAIKANLARLDGSLGRSDSTLAIGGGMIRTSYFTSTLATILGESLRVGPPDSSLVGAARMAALTLGLGTESPAEQFTIVEPDESHVSDFNYLYEEWIDRSQRLSDIPI
jgi:autoinducer 2 (AI-2) kinase